jgi:two-component system, NarL family, response regulator NreC
MTTIVLADDHPIIRRGLRTMLEAESDLTVVAEAQDGQAALLAVEKHTPDVLIVDISMPGLNGIDVAHRVHKEYPQIKVIVLSMHSNESYVLKALRNGVSGYVLKASSTDDLVTAVHKVMAGEMYFSAAISQRAIDLYVEKARSSNMEPYDTLTSREREVLQLSAEGLTNNEIAVRLCLSSRTIEMHRANLMSKLNLRNQTDLIRFAIQQGILSPE